MYACAAVRRETGGEVDEPRGADTGPTRRPDAPSPERRVVLADVARMAGTSEATASRALKDDPRIGEATRDAVRAAALTLGYVPNAAARSLRARRTHILGLLLDDLADPVHGKVAAGFEEAAAGHGFAVFIMTGLHDPEREQRALTAFVEHRADGSSSRPASATQPMCSPASQPSASSSSSLITRASPMEPNRRPWRPADRRRLRSDRHYRHLVDRGYRRIAYVRPRDGPRTRSGERRLRQPSTTSGRRSASSTPAPTAGATHPRGERDRRGAPGGRHVLRRQARARAARRATLDTLDVPGDLAVVGFDGIAAARQSLPRLTTVAVPSTESAVGRSRC